MAWDDEHARRQVARAEELLSGLETLPDGVASARAAETVETLVGLYGECLTRIVEHLARAEGDAGAEDGAGTGDACSADGDVGAATLLQRLAADELVGHLLLVHDLHPIPAQDRVRRALEDLRPHLRSRGTDMELLELSDTVVRVRLRDGGRGCSSTPEPLEQTVRDAIAGSAPEIHSVEVETAPALAAETLIPVDALFRRPALAGWEAG